MRWKGHIGKRNVPISASLRNPSNRSLLPSEKLRLKLLTIPEAHRKSHLSVRLFRGDGTGSLGKKVKITLNVRDNITHTLLGFDVLDKHPPVEFRSRPRVA